MQILYKNETVKKQFCSDYKKKWRYPEQVKKETCFYRKLYT